MISHMSCNMHLSSRACSFALSAYADVPCIPHRSHHRSRLPSRFTTRCCVPTIAHAVGDTHSHQHQTHVEMGWDRACAYLMRCDVMCMVMEHNAIVIMYTLCDVCHVHVHVLVHLPESCLHRSHPRLPGSPGITLT